MSDWLGWLNFGVSCAMEHMNAPWLPRWRRYASLPVLLASNLIIDRDLRLGAVLLVIWALLYIWNGLTALYNRTRDKKPPEGESKKASARLTEVATRAFRRQVAEAT